MCSARSFAIRNRENPLGRRFYRPPVLQAAGSTGRRFYRPPVLQAAGSTGRRFIDARSATCRFRRIYLFVCSFCIETTDLNPNGAVESDNFKFRSSLMISRLLLWCGIVAIVSLCVHQNLDAFAPDGGGTVWKCEQNAVHWCGPNWHSPHCDSEFDICMNPDNPNPEIRKCYPNVGSGPCLGFTCEGLCDNDPGRPCANWFPYYCAKA